MGQRWAIEVGKYYQNPVILSSFVFWHITAYFETLISSLLFLHYYFVACCRMIQITTPQCEVLWDHFVFLYVVFGLQTLCSKNNVPNISENMQIILQYLLILLVHVTFYLNISINYAASL